MHRCIVIDIWTIHKYLYITVLYYELLFLTLTVLVTTIDAQWEVMGDVGSARYEPALLPPCPTIRVLSYSTVTSKFSEIQHCKG